MEYPSSIQWLQGGSHAGQLAIADYNKGRVQIRSAETGTLLRTVEVDENHCVSGVAELANDCLGVVPHSSDAVALVPPAIARKAEAELNLLQSDLTRLLVGLGAARQVSTFRLYWLLGVPQRACWRSGSGCGVPGSPPPVRERVVGAAPGRDADHLH